MILQFPTPCSTYLTFRRSKFTLVHNHVSVFYCRIMIFSLSLSLFLSWVILKIKYVDRHRIVLFDYGHTQRCHQHSIHFVWCEVLLSTKWRHWFEHFITKQQKKKNKFMRVLWIRHFKHLSRSITSLIKEFDGLR